MVHNLDVEPKRKKQKVQSNNTIGYKGVSKNTNGGRFSAKISIGGKMKQIGTFDTAIAAALAYDQAAIKAGKKKSILNFPDELPIQASEEKQKSDPETESSSSSISSSTNSTAAIDGRYFDRAIAAALAYDQAAIKNGNKKSTTFPRPISITNYLRKCIHEGRTP